MLDLGIVKKDFRSLVGNVHPSTLSHFIMWLDVKVAEYKVYGHMVLDETSNDTPTWLRVQRLFEPEAASNSGDESWTQSEASANKQIKINVSSHYQTSEQQSDGIPQRHAADGQPCRSLHSLTRHTNNHGLEIEHDLSPACRNLNNYTTGHKDHRQIDERVSEQEMLPNSIISHIQLQDRCTQEIDRSVKHTGVIDFNNAGHEVQSNKISRSTIVLNEYSHSEDELQKRLTLEAEQESSAKNNKISSVLDENVIKIELSSDEESQTECLSTQQGEITELICDTGQDQIEIRKINFDPKDFSLQESNLREVSEDMSPVPQSLFRINDKSPVKVNLSTKELEPLKKPSVEDSSPKETIFQCETCNKIYKTKATLNRHKNLHRTEYVCRTCIKCFNSSDALEEHNKKKHGETFLCSTCGKSFGRLTSLADHNKLHFEKNEVCPYEQCGKSFTNKHLLADHMNSHTGFKPYSCEKCKKSYSTQASFCNHKAVCSRKKKCWECGKLFSTKSSLFDHRKSAHGVAFYVCDCGKSYKWRTNLARHKRECATIKKD